MSQDVLVRNNAESGSYDAILDDRVVGMIVYERRDDRMIFRHTIVDPDYRRRGVATTLVRTALDDLRANGLTLTNHCGFIADFIAAHPTYAGVTDSAQPGRVLRRDLRPDLSAWPRRNA